MLIALVVAVKVFFDIFIQWLKLTLILLLRALRLLMGVSKPHGFVSRVVSASKDHRIDAELQNQGLVKKTYSRQKKSETVIREIIYLAVLNPRKGCRKLADLFNRLHTFTDGETITDTEKNQNPVFGVLDSGTRANLLLETLRNKKSITLLTYLAVLFHLYGKPKIIRCDNEPIFKSGLFRLSLWLQGVKIRYSDVCCPWQNGKIERFFGTFKEAIRQIVVSQASLDVRLAEFRFWYNHVRTHNYLHGKTPAEVWNKKTFSKRCEPVYINLWQGVLTGFYFAPD
jgi:hypothetical protein